MGWINEFLKALAKYSIVFAVLLVILLFGLGTALLTAPDFAAGFLRYACAAFCFLPGIILTAGTTLFRSAKRPVKTVETRYDHNRIEKER